MNAQNEQIVRYAKHIIESGNVAILYFGEHKVSAKGLEYDEGMISGVRDDERGFIFRADALLGVSEYIGGNQQS